MKVQLPGQAARAVEWLAALAGAVNCVLVAVVFASSQESLFPLPGLYLGQIALVGVLVLAFVVVRPRPKTRRPALPWVAAGIMLTFVVLGGFSIGPFLIPAFLAFVVTGVLIDWQTGGAMGRHVGLLFLAAVFQGTVMMLVAMIV